MLVQILNKLSTLQHTGQWAVGFLANINFSGKRMKRKFLRACVGGTIAFQPFIAFAQRLSADPQGSSVIVGAVRWMQGTLLGTVATIVAVIAVAVVELLMLTGRINWRYGAIVIMGCFILFGAASIVAGIQSTASLSASG